MRMSPKESKKHLRNKRYEDQKRFERWAAFSFLEMFNKLTGSDFVPHLSEVPDLIAISSTDKKRKLGIEVTELHNINKLKKIFLKTDEGTWGTQALFETLKHVFDKKSQTDYREGFAVVLLLVNRFYVCQPHDINKFFLRRYRIPKHHFDSIFLLTPRITRKMVDHSTYQLFKLKNNQFMKQAEVKRETTHQRPRR
ncbi:MAG TPA: hypothetical protein VJB91_02525 [Patescibacteria group bacterium]|nr:hypothetical protein [Patescibacteria group bacterium]